MSATSARTVQPARQVSESLDQGRRFALQLVCGGYWLYLLLHMLFLPAVRYDPLGQELLTGYLCAVTLLLAGIPQVNFRFLTLFLVGLYTPVSLLQLSSGIASGALPAGFLGWSPVLFLLIYVLMSWRLATVLSGVLLLNIVRCLYFFPHRSSESLDAWLSMLCILVTLAVISALLSRFMEERLLSGHEVRLQLEAARMDALTRVLGRAASEDALEKGIVQAKTSRQPLSLLLCDLDNFKAINDRHGHPAGDAVLYAAARRLRRHISKMGQVGRWGGEEFVVILPGISKTDALMLAERLRGDLAASELAGIPVTASFGVSAYRVGDTLADMFERADQRLYEAKNAGRNLVRG